MARVGLVALVLSLGTVGWVYDDARTRADRGRPVEVTLGSLQLDTPAAWGIGCLLLWIFFFPLYLTGRRQAG